MEQATALKQLKILVEKGKEMRLAGEKWDAPWKTLIAIILSARTRDEKTIPIASKLFSKYNSVVILSKADIKDIQDIIRPINFYINKSKCILKCAKRLQEEFDGKVPADLEKLISLPGVGRKTANVFLSEYGEDAVGVDTHAFYISKYLGWSGSKNPEGVEEDLKKLFPKKIWKTINPILVRFGKTHTSTIKKNKILDEIKCTS